MRSATGIRSASGSVCSRTRVSSDRIGSSSRAASANDASASTARSGSRSGASRPPSTVAPRPAGESSEPTGQGYRRRQRTATVDHSSSEAHSGVSVTVDWHRSKRRVVTRRCAEGRLWVRHGFTCCAESIGRAIWLCGVSGALSDAHVACWHGRWGLGSCRRVRLAGAAVGGMGLPAAWVFPPPGSALNTATVIAPRTECFLRSRGTAADRTRRTRPARPMAGACAPGPVCSRRRGFRRL